jgi:hypothetical protein
LRIADRHSAFTEAAGLRVVLVAALMPAAQVRAMELCVKK